MGIGIIPLSKVIKVEGVTNSPLSDSAIENKYLGASGATKIAINISIVKTRRPNFGSKPIIALVKRPPVTAKKGASLAPNKITRAEHVIIGIDI